MFVFLITRPVFAQLAAPNILKQGFLNPPDSVRPGVYWYFMDGNISREGMTKDLEAMKQAGLGSVIYLEVNVGVPRGPVDFLGSQWLDLFTHAATECKRLGIDMTLGIGPGWSGSGGPWVTPENSMQVLVSSSTQITGPGLQKLILPKPANKPPFFGEGSLTPVLKELRDNYYKDVAVLAFPTPDSARLAGIDEKALYFRAPYSSEPGTKPWLPSLATYDPTPVNETIQQDNIIDLTTMLQPDGTLSWQVPKGSWTIMRFGCRNNGAVTRPAPMQGLGFEADKMDTAALNAHLDAYVGKILSHLGSNAGLKTLHMDSWEVGSQNWTPLFRTEFIKRRGYDPLPFYPVYAGYIIQSRETSERFLWDLRQTANELILERHALAVKHYSHRRDLKLSIEPYDMNPTADLDLGAIADIPMCEFWSKGYGFNTTFSCIEATSIAHVSGEPVVQAESFTADDREAWKQYPGSMKDQTDWALATGINKFYFHTFAHKPNADSLSPGMNMGPYGVHWDRKETWWSMVPAYHRYLSRCSFLLQQGKPVADILYLTPEGAPQVFLPPPSAMSDDPWLPNRKGFNFDGCSPAQLNAAEVQDGRIVFPGGASYQVLILPAVAAMTPGLLKKLVALQKAGATLIGPPLPQRAPGLSGYPASDQQVKDLARQITPVWKNAWASTDLYPGYAPIAKYLAEKKLAPDFTATDSLRYTHRTAPDWDIYFVSNTTARQLDATTQFRTTKGSPQLWDPITGESRPLPQFTQQGTQTTIPLSFAPYQSYFIVFEKNIAHPEALSNFYTPTTIATLDGPWTVSFDPHWGGPKEIVFDRLADWTQNPNNDIKYYSGLAKYTKTFDLPKQPTGRSYLDLGEVANIARVTLNGKDLGVVWTAPWRVDITGLIKQKHNQLQIEVANRWPNRLIGDETLPDDHKYTWSTFRPYKKDSPLLRSGLLGPVTIRQTKK